MARSDNNVPAGRSRVTEYSGVGGRARKGLPIEVAQDVSVMTRLGVQRIIRYAFKLARPRDSPLEGTGFEPSVPGTDGSQTHRWREPNSNHRYLSYDQYPNGLKKAPELCAHGQPSAHP